MIQLSRLLDGHNESKVFAELVYDALRFVQSHNAVITQSPLQVYTSALIFSPKSSMIRCLFQKEEPEWIAQKPIVENTWNACLQTLEGHEGTVNLVIFSPDSKIVASRSDDSVRLWSVETGTLLFKLKCDSRDDFISMTFSPDSKVVTTISHPYIIEYWSAETGELQSSHKPLIWDYILSAAWSLDGSIVAFGLADHTIRLWSTIKTQALLHVLNGHSDQINSMAFSPDGKTVASGSADSTMRLWSTETGALSFTLRPYMNDKVRSVVFSPDGKLVGILLWNTVRIWSCEMGTLQNTFIRDFDNLSVAFSPDSKVIASGSGFPGTVQLWSAETGELWQKLEGHRDTVQSIAFSPDGKVVALAASDNTVRLWSTETGLLRHALKPSFDFAPDFIIFSPNSKLVASTCNQVKIWSVEAGKLLYTLGHDSVFDSAAFSLDSTVIAAVSEGKSIQLWSTETGLSQHNIIFPEVPYHDPKRSVIFSSDGKIVASISYGVVRLLLTETGEPRHTIEVDSGLVTSIAFSPDGKVIALGLEYRSTVQLWSVETGTLKQTLNGVGYSFLCCCCSVLARRQDYSLEFGQLDIAAPVH